MKSLLNKTNQLSTITQGLEVREALLLLETNKQKIPKITKIKQPTHTKGQ